MRLINARQAWADSQLESNTSISAGALAHAEGRVAPGPRGRRQEALFPATAEDKEARIQVSRQRISISETRRTPIGRSSDRVAHLLTMGKVQQAIETLPFNLQQFGHYLYHPCLTMRHVMNASALVTSRLDVNGMSAGKRAKAIYLVTIALQSYKAQVCGSEQWGPARVAGEMKAFYGIQIAPANWSRDWKGLWDDLATLIETLDLEAQSPVWSVIHAEKDKKTA
ncbi:hypothetical protein [Pseudomonas sp. GV071]|uniref:hypothetical protein n=1 Tax=Pseudomonas sp. GV071 TaxID=2135754 RepID=UPI000D39E688|nr:hypothetical protein [Pseudomonas sp. GV071]PTQ70298.1 hypothetical protein C8K61_10620 [Pseudomonas sp. GV071]